ncbi:MAG: MFS transporter [Gemmataceae bacterium]|nr:MFS transporter [Gemmataceae bacterium]
MAVPPDDNPVRPGLGRALRHRNFRLYFAGQGISLLGTWMQQVAQNWLVYRLTNDEFLLGVVAFAGQAPAFLLLPVAGVLLDRCNRHRLVVATQALAMIQAATLAVLTLTGLLAVWQLIVLAVLLGCVNAFDLPARQSLLPALLPDKQDLGNAIALHSSLFNGARLIGPALAALVILMAGDQGEGVCFALNTVSYLAVLLALLALNVPQETERPPAPPVLRGWMEGLGYAVGHRPIRAILLMVAWVGLVGMPYTVVLPVVARQVLGGGPVTYGLLLTCVGVGALGGAFYLASRRDLLGAGRRIATTAALLGVALVVVSQVSVLALAAPLLMLVGLCMMLTLVSCNTVVQTVVADDKRGRVMSLYNLALFGMTPLGSLLVGFLADRWGAPTALLACGLGCLVGSVGFALGFPHGDPSLGKR